MTEDDLLSAVMDLAKIRGWYAFHPIPALSVRGRWLTAYRGDRGFVDLALARAGELLTVELKAQGGRMGPGQAEWGEQLGDHYRLWRPSSLPEIQRTLR